MLCDITPLFSCSRCGRKVSAAHVKAECSSGPGTPSPLPIASNLSRAFIHHVSAGPGTELKALLKDWLGIESSPTCSCSSMARRMDSLGPEWCESDQGMASILDVMRAEHAKRWADGRTILPWTDIGARQLVLLACRRAKATG